MKKKKILNIKKIIKFNKKLIIRSDIKQNDYKKDYSFLKSPKKLDKSTKYYINRFIYKNITDKKYNNNNNNNITDKMKSDVKLLKLNSKKVSTSRFNINSYKTKAIIKPVNKLILGNTEKLNKIDILYKSYKSIKFKKKFKKIFKSIRTDYNFLYKSVNKIINN